MQWSFPHKWFRLAVVLNLAGVSFQFAIDHAARRTLCCSYRAFTILADAMDRAPFLWKVNLLVLLGLALLSFFVVARVAAALWKKRSDTRPFVVDSMFTVAVPVTLFLAWTASMGHSEPNWVYGFQRGLIAISVLWTATLLATRRENSRGKLRGVVYGIGVALAVLVPAVMVSRHSSEIIEGAVFLERHAESTRYGFAVLISCLFWTVDVLLSLYRRAPGQPALPPREN